MSNATRKISILGAGMVGATLAQRVFEDGIADVVLLDIFRNIATGKALDLLDAAPIIGTERTIVATNDYNDIKGSDIVVITAGLARKPGMTREDLIAKNAAIVKEVSNNIRDHAPTSIVIVVTNPLDAMTYLALKTTGFRREKVFGMAGVLDSSRFITLLAQEIGVPRSSIETFILGSHGDTMVPLVSRTLVSGKPVSSLISRENLERVIQRTRDRGAEIVSFLGSGSAFYSPSAAVLKMINAILTNSGEVLVASTLLKGEYGLSDICIGAPCKIGSNGIEKIIQLDITDEEMSAFNRSAQAIKNSIELL